MQIRTQRLSWRRGGTIALLAAAAIAMPALAHAQFENTPAPTVVGEKYHVEAMFSFWRPDVQGIISSEQFGIPADKIDFKSDLAFEQKRFGDMRFVLRPGKKHRFRFQYTPISYAAETNLRRPIVFNGQRYDIALPVASEFEWKVWRLGYEWDAFYTSRGFVGVLFDVRQTRMTAHLASPIVDEFTSASAPLPALGLVGRAYPMRNLAINFEVSGFRLPNIDPDYVGSYYEWDIHGTFNVNENLGLQGGWRRTTTYLGIKEDIGDLKFQGIWFGAAVRY